VSKWMGPLSQWRRHFAEAKERGYTMLHYTPLQERGGSDSPYSIRNQLHYDPGLFSTKGLSNGGRDEIEAILQVAREDYGLLSLTDVVLNHTSNDTPWLVEHPEAGMSISLASESIVDVIKGYSPANSPHLAPALEIDTALIQLSGLLNEKGLPTTVKSEADVAALTGAVEKTIKDLKLWEYYTLDSATEKESLKEALSSGKVSAWTGPSLGGKKIGELADIFRAEKKIIGEGQFASRLGVHTEGHIAAGFLQAAFPDIHNPQSLVDNWMSIIDVLNVPLYQEWEEDIKAAISNVANRLKYTRLDPHGPRFGDISKE